MTFFVNLSTTHDYSINETVGAFVQLCNEYSNGCLQCMPGFFQNLNNYGWVMAQFKANYASLIEPYKLGKISTERFLDNLSHIFYFMKDMDKSERNKLLAKAWSSSIKLSAATEERLGMLLEKAGDEPVYLVSNTNELDVHAILDLLQKKYPDLEWNKAADICITHSQEPIKILPNVYLCLSYRYGAFKEQTAPTVSLLDHLSKQCSGSKTLVSQFQGDLKKGQILGFENVFNAEEFYNSSMSISMLKKNL